MKNKNMTEKEVSSEEVAMKALIVARDAFEEYLDFMGYDLAFFDIRFTAWIVSSDFVTRLSRIEIEREVKDDKVLP